MAYDKLIPTLSQDSTDIAVKTLQRALDVLNDLALTLKHAHWNVTGPNFSVVHEMLDPEIDDIRDAVDTVAERIAALGGSPNGLSTQLQKTASTLIPEYKVKTKSATTEHLIALDEQYTSIETLLRTEITVLDEADLISSNVLQDILVNLEQFQWKVRSHLA
ncbi:DNA starvation/stationary phase protection protein [Actinomycetota bacterium]|nr:DNA starvation/stationary phase protection protein [Actinomycetota bacterium]